MGKSTGIAWCDHTFNPWWGCFKISPGCKHCYAATFDKRVGGDNWTPDGPRRFFGDRHWNDPIRWDREAAAAGVRRRVFCASMADVFEDRRDLDEHRHRLWSLIDKTPHLDWLLLTKRPDVMRRLWPWPTAPKNVWAGTTMEDQERADARADDLLNVRAVVHFASVEPMIGPVSLWAMLAGRLRNESLAALGSPPLPGLTWVIAGAESGHGARPAQVGWYRTLRDECAAAGVPFLLKQAIDPQAADAPITLGAGSWRKGKGAGALIELPYLDGVKHAAFPEVPRG